MNKQQRHHIRHLPFPSHIPSAHILALTIAESTVSCAQVFLRALHLCYVVCMPCLDSLLSSKNPKGDKINSLQHNFSPWESCCFFLLCLWSTFLKDLITWFLKALPPGLSPSCSQRQPMQQYAFVLALPPSPFHPSQGPLPYSLGLCPKITHQRERLFLALLLGIN